VPWVLQRRVRQVEGLPRGSQVSHVLFNGQRLADTDSLDKYGVAASQGCELVGSQPLRVLQRSSSQRCFGPGHPHLPGEASTLF
jgi:hypothetical protein